MINLQIINLWPWKPNNASDKVRNQSNVPHGDDKSCWYAGLPVRVSRDLNDWNHKHAHPIMEDNDVNFILHDIEAIPLSAREVNVLTLWSRCYTQLVDYNQGVNMHIYMVRSKSLKFSHLSWREYKCHGCTNTYMYVLEESHGKTP